MAIPIRALATTLALIAASSSCASAPTPSPAAPGPEHASEPSAAWPSRSEVPAFLLPADACPADVAPRKLGGGPFDMQGCMLGRRACLARCKAADATACYESALVAQTGKEDALAEALFLRACRLGHASSCTNRAAGILNGAPSPRPTAIEDCTTRTFDMTCRAGDAWGCTMFGLALDKRGERGEQVRTALEAACTNSTADDPACVAARQLLEKTR